jgi:glycosyltransferase involved in cell wall biosynthesis
MAFSDQCLHESPREKYLKMTSYKSSEHRLSSLPFFSIITCTLNAANYLHEHIASVEAQEFQDFEHIFVDADSIDGTLEIIKEYQQRHPGRVKLEQRPANGISDAMNAGVRYARGRVIVHLHSDDYLASSLVLFHVYELFSEINTKIIVGNCKLIGQGQDNYTWPKNVLKRRLMTALIRSMMFYTNLIPHPSLYIERELFLKYNGFDEAYRVAMDYDLWFRMLRYETITFTDGILSAYRFHEDTVSTKQMELGLIEIARIRKLNRRYYPISYAIFVVFFLPLFVIRRMLKRSSGQAAAQG